MVVFGRAGADASFRMGRRRRPNGAALHRHLLLVALLLDDARLGRVFETVAGRNKGAPRNKDCDLCLRAVSILFECL